MFVYAATPEVPEINFQGLDVHIEWPKGSTRTGFDDEGHAWKRDMVADYGYVNETQTSADGESLDVYVGPDHEAPEAYVISQNTKEGEYDEFKVMLGCRSQEEAVALYRKHYPPELDLVGDVWPITVERLKELVGQSRGAVEKTARFLRVDEVRAAGRTYRASEEFQLAMSAAAPGKEFKDLTFEEMDRFNMLSQKR